MESKIKHCIISGHNNTSWYKKGCERLNRSLIYHGFNGDILINDYSTHDDYDNSCPYIIKSIALKEAIEKGYTHILWLDASVWAIRNPNLIFDYINSAGWYFWQSGYNCAQVCSDNCLKYFNVNRNKAESFKDCSTSMFGLNLYNPKAEEFAKMFIKSAEDKIFHGSREHDNQSKDERFLFHRQDQSCASVIANLLEMKIEEPNLYSSYYSENINNSVIFLMRGM